MKLLFIFISVVLVLILGASQVISHRLTPDLEFGVSSSEEQRIRSAIQKEIRGVSRIGSNNKLRQDISNLLFNQNNRSGNYDLKNRPEGSLNGTGPVIVTVSTYIQNIDKISDIDMEFTIRFIFRESWTDNRFIYGDKEEEDRGGDDGEFKKQKPKYILLTEDEANKIWTPDLYFSNEKEGSVHSVRKPISYTRTYPNGLVLQSSKLSVKFSCDMPVQKFPLDSQKCPIRISSFGYLKEEVELVWDSDNPVDLRLRNAKLPYYIISPFDQSKDLHNSTNETSTGQYSRLILWLRFTRKFGIYLMQLYLPTNLLVIMSWAPFWIDPEEGKDSRFAIGIGIILCLITQTYVSTKDSPPTAYIKGSDWWIGFCQLLIFLAFLEYIYVNYLIQCGSLLPLLLPNQLGQQRVVFLDLDSEVKILQKLKTATKKLFQKSD